MAVLRSELLTNQAGEHVKSTYNAIVENASDLTGVECDAMAPGSVAVCLNLDRDGVRTTQIKRSDGTWYVTDSQQWDTSLTSMSLFLGDFAQSPLQIQNGVLTNDKQAIVAAK